MQTNYNSAEFVEFMYCYYDRLMQELKQSPASKEFQLQRQQYYADRYCQLTAHISPMPTQQ